MLLIILIFMIISISTNYEEIIMKTICEVNLKCFILHQIYYEK